MGKSIQPQALSGKYATSANQNLPKKPILLIGDIIYDIHHYGEGKGMSIEAPVPVGLHEETISSWGGGGLVARNLLALGVPTIFLSLIGSDPYGKELLMLKDKNLTKKFFVDRDRHTIVKERFLIGGEKVLRWNRGDSKALTKEMERRISTEIKKAVSRASVVLVADYRHGLMSRKLAEDVIKHAHKAHKEVWVDAQITRNAANHIWYEGADFICLNQKEVQSLDKRFNIKDLTGSLKRLQKKLVAKNVTIKLGSQGSVSLVGDDLVKTPAFKVKEVDAVGAGDAFFAALGKWGEVTPQSLAYASKWAALAATTLGTEPPTLNMLNKLI